MVKTTGKGFSFNPKAWIEPKTLNNSVQKVTGATKSFIMNVCVAIILIGVSFVIVSPILAVISRSIMDPMDAINPLIYLIPQNFTLQNINNAIQVMDYWNTLGRTLAFSLGFALLHVVVTSLVGYGFARFKFPGAGPLFALVIISIVVPVQTYMVPMFLNFRFFMGSGNINLIGSIWALGLLTLTGVGLRSGLYIYIFRQFFRGLPKEIEEAAFIDGAGPFRTYLQVMIPNATPAIVTVLLFAFVWHYNDTFYTSLLMPNNRLLSVLLIGLGPNFQSIFDERSPILTQMVVFAGVMLAIIPILTIYLFLQRYFVEGLERSGIVG
ncbi:MAG: carbohydrate ABC transporter permease [Defluviitaleaceae bacterium]|nr:carbohydrate ABC transporter permease [Defluviitaleaceae bacterium]